MDNVNYERWADFYAEMLHANGVGVGEKICECACGTGGLTLPLVSYGGTSVMTTLISLGLVCGAVGRIKPSWLRSGDD